MSRARDSIELAIKNNGADLRTSRRKQPGMGLRIMRQRAGIMGGTLTVQEAASGGIAVVCNVRLSSDNHLNLSLPATVNKK